MKKFFALLLAAVMLLSLAACGGKGNDAGADQPADALALLEAVWNSYSEDDKFPAAGGDYDEANMTDGAPGRFGIEDGDTLNYSLSFPAEDAGKLADAASLVHMMNANTFTSGAFHLADAADADAVVSDIRDNVMSRQWMCGFPDKLVIATLGDFIVSCYGAEDLVNAFRDKLTAVYSSAVIVCDEPIVV